MKKPYATYAVMLSIVAGLIWDFLRDKLVLGFGWLDQYVLLVLFMFGMMILNPLFTVIYLKLKKEEINSEMVFKAMSSGAFGILIFVILYVFVMSMVMRFLLL